MHACTPPHVCDWTHSLTPLVLPAPLIAVLHRDAALIEQHKV